MQIVVICDENVYSTYMVSVYDICEDSDESKFIKYVILVYTIHSKQWVQSCVEAQKISADLYAEFNA